MDSQMKKPYVSMNVECLGSLVEMTQAMMAGAYTDGFTLTNNMTGVSTPGQMAMAGMMN